MLISGKYGLSQPLAQPGIAAEQEEMIILLQRRIKCITCTDHIVKMCVTELVSKRSQSKPGPTQYNPS